MDDASQPTNPEPWLVLLHAEGIGVRTCLKLLSNFTGPEEILRAKPADLAASGLTKQQIDGLRRSDPQAVNQDLQWLAGDRNHLLTLADSNYPPLLRAIADPPPVLFIHGNPDCLSRPQIAIVGSRNPSPSGIATARLFSRHLAAAGLIITSGLACGIDAASHQGALETGLTLAVTGTGLDRVYPARNRELAHQIAAAGALISEFPLGTPPIPANFPRRNRIISALSVGTLVVEATLRSGSLITARLAAEQGREVFAIPGSIHSPLAKGCHSLLKQGAKLVETAEDIIEELAPLLGILDSPTSANPESNAQELDREYEELLSCMGYDPVSTDQLIERSGLAAGVVSSMLLLLELQGYVSSAPGGMFYRTGNS